jgi:2-polyprenyl-6-methoxyphenol hydroxylase-like FAD-dependent oxidoreductase
MTKALRILIAGGGIGGLALAFALRQRGLGAEVVERAVAWDHAGTGLFLPANGVRALGVLGLDASTRARGCVIARQRVLITAVVSCSTSGSTRSGGRRGPVSLSVTPHSTRSFGKRQARRSVSARPSRR